MAELFGYEIKRKKEAAKAKSFVAPSDEEGTLDIAGGAGFFGQYLSYDKAARNEYDLIRKYRTTAENPECDQAIEDIINESVIADELDGKKRGFSFNQYERAEGLAALDFIDGIILLDSKELSFLKASPLPL